MSEVCQSSKIWCMYGERWTVSPSTLMPRSWFKDANAIFTLWEGGYSVGMKGYLLDDHDFAQKVFGGACNGICFPGFVILLNYANHAQYVYGGVTYGCLSPTYWPR
eukprot:7655166-Ditylum_brightwellii.AAC.1